MTREERTRILDENIKELEINLKKPFERNWMPFDQYIKVIIALELNEIILTLKDMQEKN